MNDRTPKNEVYYRQSIDYSDKRTRIVALISMETIKSGNYLVVSTSPDVLRNNHITHILNELVVGYHTTGASIPGCSFDIQDNQPGKSYTVVKDGENYRCY
jgi:hypothetical protein